MRSVALHPGKVTLDPLGVFDEINQLSARSCPEATMSVAVYIGSQARLLDRLRQQIHPVADQFGQAPFQCAGCEQPDASVRVELDNNIDVASGFSIAPQCNPGTCAICAPIS